jgi:signal transduction histidine kinase/DNA-binding response OmpR family regulator
VNSNEKYLKLEEEAIGYKIPVLQKNCKKFIANKEKIVTQWVTYDTPKKILTQHKIDTAFFVQNYANGVFDYFMGVISGNLAIGNCPVMQELLVYLKFREIGADELFEICSHFRRSMLDVSYDIGLNSKELFDEISFIFDKNFRGILKYYTDTIFQKLVDARQEALRASQAREYFLSNMSHEIRTPLNAILGFVNLLIDEDISKKHRNYLEIILNSGENLLSIINDILDFSKLRSGEFTIEPKVFSLHEELSHTMELFVASANSKEITITSYIDPNIPSKLFADALRIKQVLSNFLSNAIKFTPSGGLIAVEASYQDERLRISVKDNGIGIKEDDLQNIFSAFAQAHFTNTQSVTEGTGLGLSISHQLAELMHGEVGVVSSYGQGSTFWLEIPVDVKSQNLPLFDDMYAFDSLKIVLYSKDKELGFKHESFIRYAEFFHMKIEVVDSLDGVEYDLCVFVYEDVENSFKENILNSQKHFIALMSREYGDYENYEHINSLCFPLYCSKIYKAFHELFNPKKFAEYSKNISLRFQGHLLVAEDNEANQELIKIILKRYGLTFDLAVNGLEAFNLYKKNHYDLILMDEQMPLMDGTEALKQIIAYEEENGLAHTPISALTANVIKGAKERDLLIGFDAFLGKPVVLKELEKVFGIYLKPAYSSFKPKSEAHSRSEDAKEIVGVDIVKLKKELMLTQDELQMLLELFISKMRTVLGDLKDAIEQKDYKQIALKAHNIKGSSGNFRIEELLKASQEMEKKAKAHDNSYDYKKQYDMIKKRIEEIKVI